MRVRFGKDGAQVVDLAGVEAGLFGGKQAISGLFGFWGEFRQEGGVALQSAQHEGAYQAPQGGVVAPHVSHHGGKFLLVAQQAGGQKAEEAVQFHQGVLHRGAGQGHAPPSRGLQPEYRLCAL